MPMLAADLVEDVPEILLVLHDAALRRATHLLLAAQGYRVKSHALADRAMHDVAARCSRVLIAATERPGIAAGDAPHAMRAAGWRGEALLLAAGEGTGTSGRHARDAGCAHRLAVPCADYELVAAVASLLGEPVRPALPPIAAVAASSASG